MNSKLFKKYAFVFLLFIIGSFIGFAHENLLTLIKGHYHLRQGLLYAPLIPIYGLGLLVFYAIYSNLNINSKNKFLEIIYIFLIGLFVGGITEYLCSFFQEKIFGTISWDYSYLKFNLNGRTSLFHASFWGLSGVLFYEFVLPVLKKLKKLLDSNWLKIVTIILSICLLFDCSISTIACLRQTQRRNGIMLRIKSKNF